MESIITWGERARCKGQDTNDYFPEKNITKDSISRRSCKVCPVMGLCMTYAIAHDEEGMWGGTLTTERKAMGQDVIESIREYYYSEGLLEFRPGEVGFFLRRKQEQLREQYSPSDAQVPVEGPTSDPYFQAF